MTHLIVVRWQLVKKLFDTGFLPRAVHIRHFVFWQAAVVLMNLNVRKEGLQYNAWVFFFSFLFVMFAAANTDTHTNTHS